MVFQFENEKPKIKVYLLVLLIDRTEFIDEFYLYKLEFLRKILKFVWCFQLIYRTLSYDIFRDLYLIAR